MLSASSARRRGRGTERRGSPQRWRSPPGGSAYVHRRILLPAHRGASWDAIEEGRTATGRDAPLQARRKPEPGSGERPDPSMPLSPTGRVNSRWYPASLPFAGGIKLVRTSRAEPAIVALPPRRPASRAGLSVGSRGLTHAARAAKFRLFLVTFVLATRTTRASPGPSMAREWMAPPDDLTPSSATRNRHTRSDPAQPSAAPRLPRPRGIRRDPLAE